MSPRVIYPPCNPFSASSILFRVSLSTISSFAFTIYPVFQLFRQLIPHDFDYFGRDTSHLCNCRFKGGGGGDPPSSQMRDTETMKQARAELYPMLKRGMTGKGFGPASLTNTRWKDMNAGYDKSFSSTTIDIPVSLIDIPPTICSMFEVEPAASFKGKSLYPFDSIKPYTLYGEAMGKIGHKEKDTDKPVQYMVEDGLKVIYKHDGSLWEAYDINADPLDIKDISSSLSEDTKDKLNNFINRNK